MALPEYSTCAKTSDEVAIIIDNLEEIQPNDVPEGIEPIEFKTMNDLEKFIVNQLVREPSIELDYANVIFPMGWGVDPVNHKLTFRVNWGVTHWNLEVDIQMYYIWYHKEVISILNSRQYLSGVTLGLDLSSTTQHVEIRNGGKRVYAEGSGTLDHYFLIEGLIKMWSEPVGYYFTWDIDSFDFISYGSLH